MPNIYYPSPPPPPPPLSPPPPSLITTTAPNPLASHFPPKVSFRDNTVELFELKFYIDLGLLKTIYSYLGDETQLFKIISLATLYLYKNSLECKVKSLLKIMKNINNITARKLSKKAIKSDNKVKALISTL
jgi:hypothetical protein